MRLLVLATVTGDGRPINGPVDGIFDRGDFYFGSSPESVRFRHIARRPWVSATHLPGEPLSVTVHGRAELADLKSSEQAGFRKALLDVYVPMYGKGWEKFVDSGPVYALPTPTACSPSRCRLADAHRAGPWAAPARLTTSPRRGWPARNPGEGVEPRFERRPRELHLCV